MADFSFNRENLVPLEIVRDSFGLRPYISEHGKKVDPLFDFLWRDGVDIFFQKDCIRHPHTGEVTIIGDFLYNSNKSIYYFEADAQKLLEENINLFIRIEDMLKLENMEPFYKRIILSDDPEQVEPAPFAGPFQDEIDGLKERLAQTDAELEALRAENASLREELARARAEQIATAEDAGELARVQMELDALRQAVGLVPGEKTPTAPLPLVVSMRRQGKSEEEILRRLDHMQSNGKPWLFPAQIGVLFFLSEVWDGDTYRKKASDKLKEYELPSRMKG